MAEFVTQHGLSAVLILAILLAGAACAARYTVHPGALNKTDSAAYDSLLIAEAAIDQARSEVKAGQFPAKAVDAFKTVVLSYNIARESWVTYRGAIATKVPSQDYFDKLTKNLADLTNAIEALKEAK
jgi:hypothetical protein